MDIIIEGNDAGGKSTLAKAIAERCGLSIIESEGPEKFPGEINERIRRYLDHKVPYVYDRHPCVSQAIYATVLGRGTMPDPELSKEYGERAKFVIYCRPLLGARGFEKHEVNPEVDNPEHLAGVEAKYKGLLELYDQWALHHADYVYRLGVDFKRGVHAAHSIFRTGV